MNIIGADFADFPFDFAGAIVETKKAWGDDWAFDPELQLVSCAVHASSHQLSTCQVERRYGSVKLPYETDFSTRTRRNMLGDWLRVSMIGEQGPMPIFVGQIESPATKLTGTLTVPSGTQAWIAAGPLRILEKTSISQSVFLNADNTTATVGWVQAMNSRDKHNLLVGNRSDNAGPDSYCYGGKSIWTHLQYLNYLIAQFLNTTDDGPAWSTGGQTSILNTMKTTIRFSEAGNAMEMLKLLIPVKYGVDWFIVPVNNGFAIRVFALSNNEESVSGVTMPKNPNVVRIDRVGQKDLIETQVVESTERRVDRVQVIGKRIVVCGTLRGGQSTLSGSTSSGVPETLAAKWQEAVLPWFTGSGMSVSINSAAQADTSIEKSYMTADGSAVNSSFAPTGQDATVSDAIRKQEKYREVYQHLGAPADWDLDKGKWAVYMKDDGTLTDAAGLAAENSKNGKIDPPIKPSAYYQTAVRETLSWLPMFEGFDYSTTPETDLRLDSSQQPSMKTMIAWILDERPMYVASPRFVECHQAHINVLRPPNDWGVILDASPNHELAYTHWSERVAGDTVMSHVYNDDTTDAESPRYNYETALCTIAIESDHRIGLAYALPAALAAGDGSVMTILDEESECWVLLAGTVVGVSSLTNDLVYAGTTDPLGNSIPATNRILRNDSDRLALLLAGAVSKYIRERVRAAYTFKGFLPWTNLLGQILIVTQDGDEQPQAATVITSIEWILSPVPVTVVKTGYA